MLRTPNHFTALVKAQHTYGNIASSAIFRWKKILNYLCCILKEDESNLVGVLSLMTALLLYFSNYLIFFYRREKKKLMEGNTNKALTLLRLCWRYDVTTAAGRRVQSLKIIGVAMIAITGLLIFVVEDVNYARENIKKAEILKKNLESSLQVALLIHRLQIERGLTVLCLGSKSAEDKDRVFETLSDARHNTDKVLGETEWPFDETAEREFLRGPQNFKRHLKDHR